jgi:hypothetical protein
MEYSYYKLMISTTHTIKVHNICNASLLNTTNVPPINCMFFYVHTNNENLASFWLQLMGGVGVSTSEIKTWEKLLRDFINPPQTLKSYFGPINFQLLSMYTLPSDFQCYITFISLTFVYNSNYHNNFLLKKKEGKIRDILIFLILYFLTAKINTGSPAASSLFQT